MTRTYAVIAVLLYLIAGAVSKAFGLSWWQVFIVVVLGAAAGSYSNSSNR